MEMAGGGGITENRDMEMHVDDMDSLFEGMVLFTPSQLVEDHDLEQKQDLDHPKLELKPEPEPKPEPKPDSLNSKQQHQGIQQQQQLQQQQSVDDAESRFEQIKARIFDKLKAGHIEVAKELFHQLSDHGLKPNVYTYCIMINGLCKEGLPDEAYRLFGSMGDNDCLAFRGSFATAILQRQRNFLWKWLVRAFVQI